jgi:hypothetical protein
VSLFLKVMAAFRRVVRSEAFLLSPVALRLHSVGLRSLPAPLSHEKEVVVQLFEWWNLIFELPFLVAFVIVLVMATGAVPMGEGGGEADHDMGLDHHLELSHDFDHDVGHDLGHGGGHTTHEAGDHGGLGFMQVFTLLGVGKVPMALIFMSLSVTWGFIGWTSNQVLGSLITSPAVFVPISVVLALMGSFFLTRYVALLFSRLIPNVETYGVTSERLVGKTGEARYPISETFGEALVRDRYGQLHQVTCRTLPGKEAIPSGSKVILYQYDSDHDWFYAVTEMQFQLLTSKYAPKPRKEL